jgi:signal transduction histidine kinase
VSAAEPAAQSSPRLRLLAWGLCVAAIALFVFGAVVNIHEAIDKGHSVGWILGKLVATAWAPLLGFGIAGLLVALRRPANPAGWIMLVVALGWGSTMLPGEGPSFAYFSAMPWILPFGLMGTHLLLRLPDGHLPSPGWRWVSRASTASIAVAGTFLPSEDGASATVASVLGLIGLFALLVCILLSVASLFVRRRRADAVERHQLRWIATGAAVFFGVYILSFVPGMLGFGAAGDLGGLVFLAYAAIPTGIGIAILKYRLWDIDVVIRKALIVAVLAVFFTLVYAFVVGFVGALVGARSTTGLSFVAAALVAIGFQPVLARARRFADRFVYGKRATPYEVLAEFSERVGETYADDDVLERMARVVAEGVGAEHAEVWIGVDDHLRVAARWPESAGAPPAPLPIGDALPPIPGADAAFPVEHQGELLGALSVTTPANDPMDPAKTRLVGDLAAQAGLVLRNVRLTAALRSRLVELQAAQKRLVTAQDEERRRIERNIHDGAQQQLVALAVKARLAAQFTGKDPGKAGELVAQIEEETRQALEDLRDLARGIYPPLLADKGLVSALEAQARRSLVPTTVIGDGVGRFDQETEAAVYFSCLEALQNVAKYARASAATVRLANCDGRLSFEVRDDGIGFDPTELGIGTGMQGMVDRLGALGGTLNVASSPNAGTTVRGSLPIEAASRTTNGISA